MKEITNFEDFNNLIESTKTNQNQTIILDFYADWCGPCKTMIKFLETLTEDEIGASIYKINVDTVPEASNIYSIRSIPSLIFIRNGEMFDKHVGNISKSELLSKIK
jgi:thioredoxin 1